MVNFYVLSVLLFATLLLIIKGTSEKLMHAYVQSNPGSNIKNYFKMTNEKKWFFTACLLGTVHAIALVVMCFVAVFSCEVPTEGQTFANNETCFMTPNIWNYRLLAFFSAYCTVDLFNVTFLQKDFSSGAL